MSKRIRNKNKPGATPCTAFDFGTDSAWGLENKQKFNFSPMNNSSAMDSSSSLEENQTQIFGSDSDGKFNFGTTPSDDSYTGGNKSGTFLFFSTTVQGAQQVFMKEMVEKGVVSIESVQNLLKQNSKAASTVNEHGKFPIHYAIEKGSSDNESVQLLLEAYPEAASKRDNNGDILLTYALKCKSSSVECIQLIANAYPEAVVLGSTDDKEGCFVARKEEDDPRDTAIRFKSITALEEFANKSFEEMRMEYYMKKISQEQLSTDHLSLEPPMRGITPLKYALQHKSFEYLRVLLHAHPEAASTVDEYGKLPIHYAVEKGFDKKINLLLEAYPEALSKADNNGSYPLLYAVKSGSMKYIQMLLEAYPEAVSKTDNEGKLPLHHATKSGSVESTRILFEAFSEAASTRDLKGNLPLQYAPLGSYRRIRDFLEPPFKLKNWLESSSDELSVDVVNLIFKWYEELCHVNLSQRVLDMYRDRSNQPCWHDKEEYSGPYPEFMLKWGFRQFESDIGETPYFYSVMMEDHIGGFELEVILLELLLFPDHDDHKFTTAYAFYETKTFKPLMIDRGGGGTATSMSMESFIVEALDLAERYREREREEEREREREWEYEGSDDEEDSE